MRVLGLLAALRLSGLDTTVVEETLRPERVRVDRDAAWAALALCLALAELGPVLELSNTIIDLSPFAHSPQLPGGPFSAAPLTLALIAAALGALGLAGLRRRDLAPGAIAYHPGLGRGELRQRGDRPFCLNILDDADGGR